MQTSSHTRALRQTLLKTAVVLVSVSCALLAGEAFVRFGAKAWPFEQDLKRFPYLTEKDRNLRWRFSPEEGRNSLGLRNAEVTPKQSSQRRILFLGDSLVWSGHTSLGGMLYTRVIEKNLNDALGAKGRPIQVINAGVPGYTTYQELEFLKVYGLDMQPDVVVLVFALNDVFYKYLHKPAEDDFLTAHPDSGLHRFNTKTFPGSLFAKSHLAHKSFYAAETLAKKITGRPAYPFEHRYDLYLSWKDYGWDDTRALLGEMRGLLDERGIKLIVVSFPAQNQVDERYLAPDREYVLFPQRKLEELCKDANIPFVNLWDLIHSRGGVGLYSDYIHLNGTGNDLVAAELTRYLIEHRSLWFDK
ncbi:MAG: SGNH/GDSL hydrolase family protein [Acidobacteriota bacterium]|nr:SGNH/GDSL hydrolase family protein [Acidobacteriota bacterium]